jgi:hypothetical protein
MFYVALRQTDQGLQHPVYVGPFHNEESAYEYADEENLRLSMRGIPSWVASYAVTA